MSLSFVEIGDECTQQFFSITSNNEVLLNNTLSLKITSIEKIENIVSITTDKYTGEFGEHNNHPLNYFFLVLLIDTLNGEVLFGSKIVYGYNVENSYIDILTQALITNNLYTQFKERFDIAYGEDMKILPIFLNYMFNNTTLSYKQTAEKLQELCNVVYPLKKMCKPLEKCDFESKYNWMIVRNTEKEPGFLEDILTAILLSKNQNVSTFYETTKTELDKIKNIDIFIVINNNETIEYCSDESYIITCPDAFYQSSRRLLRNLPKVLDWTNKNQIPDKTITIKELNLDSQEGGCGGCSKEGGCCKDKKDVPTQVVFEVEKSSSCCQGKTSGCCKSENATEEDKSKCGTGNCKGGCK